MVLFTEQEIQDRVQSLALEISYKDNPENKPRVMIGVLNGAFMFFADLVRNLKVDCEIDFIQAKSYLGQTQHEIKILKDINIDISQKDVYIVDDIFDSGNTMKHLLDHLQKQKPASITPVTLFKRNFSNHPDLLYGFELTNEGWLVGYGLDDENGLKRNQTYITGTLNDE